MGIAEEGSVLFVYYKIDASQHAKTYLQLQEAFSDLKCTFPNLEIELMQRPEKSVENQETWMEIYRFPGGVKGELYDHIEACALRHGLPSNRKVERFIPLRTI